LGKELQTKKDFKKMEEKTPDSPKLTRQQRRKAERNKNSKAVIHTPEKKKKEVEVEEKVYAHHFNILDDVTGIYSDNKYVVTVEPIGGDAYDEVTDEVTSSVYVSINTLEQVKAFIEMFNKNYAHEIKRTNNIHSTMKALNIASEHYYIQNPDEE
jgi:hypothetical protein